MTTNDRITEFLKNQGVGNGKPEIPQPPRAVPEAVSIATWDKVIVPESTYLVTGDIGAGKSAVCYWIQETYCPKYNLKPVTVGLPRDKRGLLPPNFIHLDDPEQLTQQENVIAFVDEAGIQIPLDDTKVREEVSNFLAIVRQRNMILLLCYHFPRLVLARYLPFFAGFLFKRPPFLIEFASKSKNDQLAQMMYKARDRFEELVPPGWTPSASGPLHPEEVTRHTYVVSPRIRWEGMLTSPTPSFWKTELSKIWAGTEIHGKGDGKKVTVTPEMRVRAIEVGNGTFMDPWTNETWQE